MEKHFEGDVATIKYTEQHHSNVILQGNKVTPSDSLQRGRQEPDGGVASGPGHSPRWGPAVLPDNHVALFLVRKCSLCTTF